MTPQLDLWFEEEKLAGDVNQQFGQLSGGGVFDNIEASEVMHQQELLQLLGAKGIPDPRVDQPGVFKDQRIQQM